MSVFRKNETGVTNQIAGNIVQRWNNRIFATNYELVNGIEYYTIDNSANRFIFGFTPNTLYQLELLVLNTTSDVVIKYNGVELNVVQSNGNPILPGTLRRYMVFYTKTVLDGAIYYDSRLELLPAEVKYLYELNTNTNAFTNAEKQKLATVESSKFVGQYLSVEALELAHPNPPIGSYALVDGGVDIVTSKYIWDSSDLKWVKANDPMQELTPEQIKQLYEENLDTNAFTDYDKIKLQSIKDYTEIITNTTSTSDLLRVLKFAQDITYTNILTALTVIIPDDISHGYYCSVNFRTGDDIDLNIQNDSLFILKIMKYDKQLINVELSSNKTVNMSFYCDGINLYCYYTEV